MDKKLRFASMEVRLVLVYDLEISFAKAANGAMTQAEKKLQRDTELMQRLTGIWEEKWSKTQKLMEVSKVTDFHVNSEF